MPQRKAQNLLKASGKDIYWEHESEKKVFKGFLL